LFQLDLAARRSAIQAAHRHRVRSLIFINFTPTSIYDPQFCLRSTVGAIDEAGISHDQIVFELTESDRTQEIEHLQAILRFYRSAGFRVALDDMGSGYSGLNLLHQLRPDFIKLDMELTRNVHQDPYKALIAEKVLDIAQKLQIQTVAEGIESPEELAWVREHGADFVQGYCIARPSPQPVTQTPVI
jgi:EAL domain-containing protein (putative c-di-GMP-specific phosphodiesterase class I)